MAPQLPSGHKIVHLELKTGNLGRACSFYGGLLGWRPERISAGGWRSVIETPDGAEIAFWQRKR
jgi:predicted enzyme related to lactoylglutathione lyase